MDFVPLKDKVGIEVRGADLAALSEEDFAALRQAWVENGVMVIRGQSLDGASLQGLAARFGELEGPPASERSGRDDAGASEAAYVWYISNVVENGKPIGSLGAGEAEWHTDMSYLETPPTASLLYAHEIPPEGGNTSFGNMAAALDDLPEPLRESIEGRTAKHNSSYTSAGELRKGAEAVSDPSQAPGISHPIVRTHPESGRKSLFLGRRRNGYIDGLTLAESDRILDEIWAFCGKSEFYYEHVWQTGDLLIWDNRSMIHRREAFDPTSRRVMLRAQVKGDRPR